MESAGVGSDVWLALFAYSCGIVTIITLDWLVTRFTGDTD